MNKIFKCAFGLLTLITTTIAGFSSAENFNGNIGIWNDLPANSQIQFSTSLGDFICISTTTSACNDLTLTLGNISNRGNPYGHILCVFGELNNRAIVVNNNTSNNCPFYNIRGFKSDFQDNICSTMSSLECQTEYNLIPIEEVTANYCRLNFDLIDPAECPINSGTGTIVRSNLMINDIPYAQNQNINVFIPDFLNWNIAFNDFNTVIDIEGYNADEEYIENVINNEKLTPTPEDFTYFIQGIAQFIPYLFIGLLILFAVKVFGKVWK